ncbi:hypothetical protein [Vibrio fortis]|uniref:hypothetical protein n=1 Tax=Vibrio fortis TaxID=212667 RepID=UPI0038CD6757
MIRKLPLGTDLIVSNLSFKSTKPNIKTTSHNEKVNALGRNVQYYSGTITLFARNKKAKRKLEAFLEDLNGQAEIFELHIPDMDNSLEQITGTPSLVTDYAGGVETIVLDSFTGEISTGDYFKLANDLKVYRALNDAKAGQQLRISPSLRKAHRARNIALFSDFNLVVRLEEDNFKMEAQKGNVEVMKVKLKFKEEL